MPAVRMIGEADIPEAMRLKEAAGWNQTAEDWRNLLRLAPDGCYGIDCDGTLAATTTAVRFGRHLAWIGMVLTHPEYRGRGFARRLMEHALERLDVDWIKLDATDMGRPLYLQLGFEDEGAVERWGLAGNGGTGRRGDGATMSCPPWRLDREAFGAGRGELLRVLASIECLATADGYAMGRPGTKAYYFGPCVARTAETARELLRSFLDRHASESVYWDILPANTDAIAMARERGFQPMRKLVRMARRCRAAAPFLHDDSKIFAIAGFEYG